MKVTNDKGIKILISVLKHNNIKKIIASPGTTNMAFVASVQNDPYFEVFSCVDERSACYMACGLSVESKEVVVLTCTGATASRNYLPGLTEAFYRKIPILAITFAQHFGNIGNNIPQAIDRTYHLKDVVNLSVQIPIINSIDDEYGCNYLINKAVLELKHNGGGPVHINMTANPESYYDFVEDDDFKTRFIDRIEYKDDLPNLFNSKIAIFVGAHKIWSEELTNSVDEFCEKYNSVVLTDYTSNYNGKYGILANIIFDQELYKSELNNFDILIYIGDISGAYLTIKSKKSWRVNLDGELKDPFKNLQYTFQMDEKDFFMRYNKLQSKTQKMTLYSSLKDEFDSLESLAKKCDLSFSNLWIAKELSKRIPEYSTIHLAILNSLRSWNYFSFNKSLNCYSNTGGFGIDGALSSLIGASMANFKNLYYGIIGDLAFFYDMNSLGNINLGNNLRIILVNNGCGTEFHNYSHPASKLGDSVGCYIAADGHFGNKSDTLVKNYATDLGFIYLSAKNKDEFIKNIDYFVNNKFYDKSIIFEVFTNSLDESDALKTIRTLKKQNIYVLKETAKKIIPSDIIKKAKKIIKK